MLRSCQEEREADPDAADRQTFKKTKNVCGLILRVNNCPFLPTSVFAWTLLCSPQVRHLPEERSRANSAKITAACPGRRQRRSTWEWLLSGQHLRLRSVARTGRPWPRPWPLRRALRRPSQLLQPQRNRLRRLALPRLSACRRPAPHSSAGRCTSLPAPTRSSSLRHTKPTHRRPCSFRWLRSGAPGSQSTPRATTR